MKYQLPCSCGQAIPVEASQAGQTVRCSCGAQLEVPTLRLIRQLKPVRVAAGGRAKSGRNWSVASRILVTVGLAITAFGSCMAAYYQVGRYTLNRTGITSTEVAWDRAVDADLTALTNMNLEDAWKYWELIRAAEIGPYQPPPHIQARMITSYLKDLVMTGLGIAVGGLALVGIALLLPRSTPAESRQRSRKR